MAVTVYVLKTTPHTSDEEYIDLRRTLYRRLPFSSLDELKTHLAENALILEAGNLLSLGDDEASYSFHPVARPNTRLRVGEIGVKDTRGISREVEALI